MLFDLCKLQPDKDNLKKEIMKLVYLQTVCLGLTHLQPAIGRLFFCLPGCRWTLGTLQLAIQKHMHVNEPLKKVL